MKMVGLFCGLLLASTLGTGCKPRVRTVPEAITAKNSDGSVTVSHRQLKVALKAPERTEVVGTPTDAELQLRWGGEGGRGVRQLTVKAPDERTAMTPEDWTNEMALRGSSLRDVESKEVGGGFAMTYTFRDHKFEQRSGYYSLRTVAQHKIVCTHAGDESSVREAEDVCDSLRRYEPPAVAPARRDKPLGDLLTALIGS